MTEEENKEFDLLQLADEMSHKNWMYFKFLYNKKFKEAEDRTKELEAALRKIIEEDLQTTRHKDGSGGETIYDGYFGGIARAALEGLKDASA